MGTGAINDAMSGYVKAFLPLTLRFFHDVYHAKIPIVCMIPWLDDSLSNRLYDFITHKI